MSECENVETTRERKNCDSPLDQGSVSRASVVEDLEHEETEDGDGSLSVGGSLGCKGREKQHQVSRRDAKRRPGPSSDSTHLRKRETESTSEDETKKEKPSEPESNSSVQLEERSRDGGGPDLSDGLEEEERDRNQRLFLFSSRQFSPRGTTTTHPSDDHRIDKAEDDVQDDEPGEDGLL